MECSWAVIQLKTGKVTLGGAFGHGHRVFEASAGPPSSNPARRLSLWPNDSKAAGQARSSRPPLGAGTVDRAGQKAPGVPPSEVEGRLEAPAVCHPPGPSPVALATQGKSPLTPLPPSSPPSCA